MKVFSVNNSSTQRTVLVAPLDWGLGHATRCIPIIKELQQYPLRIIIAGDGQVAALLRQEFPELEMLPLPGYNIKYSKNKRWFLLKLMIQIPGVLYSVLKEHRWLNKVKQELNVCAVISDNRFGLFSRSVFSVYITHQLHLKTGYRFSDRIASQIHQYISKNYTQRWFPDYGIEKNLAGELSRLVNLRERDFFIGCLSRFEQVVDAEITIDLLIILSGPEPQRTLFEKLLLTQLESYTGKVWLIRGLPALKNESFQATVTDNIVIKNHLSAVDLNMAIEKSAMVISRSGYTTIMDLVKLRKRAILVPTPGQTEQEYLARHLAAQKMFYTTQQDSFDLLTALEAAAHFPFNLPVFDMNQYKPVIKQFAESL